MTSTRVGYVVGGRYRLVAELGSGGFGRVWRARDETLDRLHVAALEALDEPPSLHDLRRRVAKMLPAIDIGELILDVMAWHPETVEPSRKSLPL